MRKSRLAPRGVTETKSYWRLYRVNENLGKEGRLDEAERNKIKLKIDELTRAFLF